MGFKFRKSIKILPGVKINLSKSGVSTTVGVKGASVNLNKKGTYLDMGIPGIGIYDRKKISSNSNDAFSYDFNTSAKKNIENKDTNIDMGVFRKILLYIQRFFAFMFSISFLILIFDGEIWAAIFTLGFIILIDYYDFNLIKNKIFSKNYKQENLNEEISSSDEGLEYNEEIPENNDYDSYNILKSEDGEILDTQRDNNYFNILEKEKEIIYDNYGKLSVEFEEIKQFGDFNKMVDFETKVHNYFSDEILPKLLKLGLIDSIEPVKDKITFDNRSIENYEYLGKLVPIKKFEEFKEILNNQFEYYKQGTNEYLYDLYAKSLRRVGNYYKQNKLWKESLNIFTIIEDMGQAGIMDKKSIIRIRKELSK